MSSGAIVIPTRYAGCHFRSRLEARWAVFFDAMGIDWEYESEGFELPSGRWYLPDFRLTACGTYCEVKGDEERLDLSTLREAAEYLPYTHQRDAEACSGILLLGPIPRMPPHSDGDFAWALLDAHAPDRDGEFYEWCIFGMFAKNLRPWFEWPDDAQGPPFLTPRWVPGAFGYHDMRAAYAGARSARFEHGESGAT